MHRFLLLVMTSLLATAPFASAVQPHQHQGAGDDTAAPANAAAAWNQYRGPDRSGISPDTGLLRAWPEEGPRELWRRSLGEGFAGIAVAGDSFFTLFAVGEDELIGRFRVADGTEVWRRRIGDTFGDQFGNGPRATPSVAGGLVFAQGAKGKLAAVRAATGELIWEVDLQTPEFGFYGPQFTTTEFSVGVLQIPLFGYSSSPLVEGDLLIAEAGSGRGRTYVAFDKASGEVRWTAVDEPGFVYSSPQAVTIAGRRQILVFTPSALLALLPSGEVYWRRPWPLTVSQPVFVPPDKIFVSTTHVTGSPSEGGATVLKVSDDGEKAVVEPLWESRILRNYAGSSVLHEGHIYGFDNATLRCIAAETGELRWARRGLGKGTLVSADGLLLIWSDQGKLTLAEATPDGYRQKGQVRIFDEGRTWTPPTVAGGRLYLRGRTDVVCLDLKG